MPFGDITDTEIRIATAKAPKRHWRTAKWNGSWMPIRAAAAGLEANDSMTPSPISTATIPSRI